MKYSNKEGNWNMIHVLHWNGDLQVFPHLFRFLPTVPCHWFSELRGREWHKLPHSKAVWRSLKMQNKGWVQCPSHFPILHLQLEIRLFSQAKKTWNPAAQFWKAKKNSLTSSLTSNECSELCLVEKTSCLLLWFHWWFLPWSFVISLLPRSSQVHCFLSLPKTSTGLLPLKEVNIWCWWGNSFSLGKTVGCPDAGRLYERCRKGFWGLPLCNHPLQPLSHGNRAGNHTA